MRKQETPPPLHQLTGAPMKRPGDQVVPQTNGNPGFLDQRTVDYAAKQGAKATKSSKKRK